MIVEYTAPFIAEIDIKSEGVLCGSGTEGMGDDIIDGKWEENIL